MNSYITSITNRKVLQMKKFFQSIALLALNTCISIAADGIGISEPDSNSMPKLTAMQSIADEQTLQIHEDAAILLDILKQTNDPFAFHEDYALL